MTTFIREETMRATEYTDTEGVKWVTPARAAAIWNERVKREKGVEGHYTRWSVSQRKELKPLVTPGGRLYKESEIQAAKLSPHPPRPDVAETNRKRKREQGMTKKQATLDDVKRLAAELDIEFQDGGNTAFGLRFNPFENGDMFSVPGGIPIAYEMLTQRASAHKRFAQHLKEAESE